MICILLLQQGHAYAHMGAVLFTLSSSEHAQGTTHFMAVPDARNDTLLSEYTYGGPFCGRFVLHCWHLGACFGSTLTLCLAELSKTVVHACG